ncbi:MAG: hypothetical protein ACR2MP_12570 [Streptosporangiaceae bacterium]
MKWKKLGAGLDTHISDISEQAARRLSRRGALRAAVVSSVAGIGAVALGQAPAMATEKCSKGLQCGPTKRCSGCGGASNGCPSGYHLCKSSGECAYGKKNPNKQGYYCEWASGSWIACNGAGTSGAGYYVCYDCVDQGCSGWCTCLSGCICCKCTTAAELKAEQKRQQMLAAS